MLVTQKGRFVRVQAGHLALELHTSQPSGRLRTAALSGAGWVSFLGLLSPGTHPTGQDKAWSCSEGNPAPHPAAGCHLPAIFPGATTVWGQLPPLRSRKDQPTPPCPCKTVFLGPHS